MTPALLDTELSLRQGSGRIGEVMLQPCRPGCSIGRGEAVHS